MKDIDSTSYSIFSLPMLEIYLTPFVSAKISLALLESQFQRFPTRKLTKLLVGVESIKNFDF